jgi:dehydrogenase/reductase SDR family member 4
VLPVVCHVGRAAEIHSLVETTVRQFGRIDILVNNAATNIAQEPVLQVDEAKFDKMIEINLKSAFRLVQAVAPGMCARGSGSIINITSISGMRPQYHGMLYSMTKAALIMMTKSYAVELGPRGVRVNAIAPGLIQTVLSEYYWKDDGRREKQLGAQPIKHLGQPGEIAEIALMLAGGASSYVTGQTIVVDGGYLLSSM